MSTHDLRGDNIIDNRDVIARVEELEEEMATAYEQYDTDTGDDMQDTREELKDLHALMEEASDSPDWKYGETLIKDEYFEQYAKELAEDIGAVQRGANWPNNCIDWKEAAEQLRQDYFTADFGQDTYWIRS
jgi:hypothetical protein